jgi:hypothetical protein
VRLGDLENGLVAAPNGKMIGVALPESAVAGD